MIVLAAHNLALFTDSQGRPAVVTHPELEYIPRDSVLYNFEHIPSDLQDITSGIVEEGEVRRAVRLKN